MPTGAIGNNSQGMETSEVNQLLEGQTAFAEEKDGHKLYHVLPRVEQQDAERGFRVFHIGCPAEQPTSTRCVLLLGETGAGKTTFVNAVLNYLFGVQFDDPFRLQVKEETEDGRMETESQTDLITAYTIYYKEGMKHEYNFVLIDTPGLADTRGAHQQEDTRSRLEAFLTSDFGVDDLHCVGLVAKGNTNRDFESQKSVLRDISSLLGNNVPEITCIFATFAVEKPSVDAVVRNAGVPFKSMFHFDNGIFYSPQVTSTCSQRHHTILALRWDNMREQYDTFFSALISAPSVSIKILKERKLFETCKKNLEEQIERFATSIAALDIDKKIYIKYELQEARNEGWKKEERVEKITFVRLDDGIHAHNCGVCKQTCVFPCYNSSGSGLLAGLAGGAGGTAAGAVVADLTTSVISAAATRAATGRGIAASVGNMAVRTLGGAITATEVGAVAAGGTAACLVIGGVLGIAAGLFTEAMFSSMTKSCGIVGVKRVCGRDGCPHPLPEHVKEERMIIKENEIKENINKVMKELYDVAVSKKMEANAKIINGRQKILSRRRIISHTTVELMHHAKKIQELTSQDFDYIEEVTGQIISNIRSGEPNIIPHAIKHVEGVREAMRRLTSCTPEEVLGRHELVEEVLLRIYGEH
ncbi:uncharacterized protein LOC126994180 isoform X2 [Eriocheir sinensis]|uniref:uncharacterized protein LOC126994180 isoform X2 n=1 Tax=Eriocheir sinensis TaxID=95602 RepID=UPI0021C8EF0C|nr:uncharacterized protein LOC126994180 isoform X2 [Eriocheir sinensis]